MPPPKYAWEENVGRLTLLEQCEQIELRREALQPEMEAAAGDAAALQPLLGEWMALLKRRAELNDLLLAEVCLDARCRSADAVSKILTISTLPFQFKLRKTSVLSARRCTNCSTL